MADRHSEDLPGPSSGTPTEVPVPGPETRLSAYLERELERCRWGWEAGAIDALVDALRKCEEHSLPLPDWMHQALANVVAGYAATRKRSRSRRMADVRDYVRYDIIVTIRECSPAWNDELQYLRKVLAQPDAPGLSPVESELRRKDLEQLAERFERLVNAASWTDRRLFSFAADELARDRWHGKVSAEAVKASYYRVKNHLGHDAMGRYYFGLTLGRELEAEGHESAAARVEGGVADALLELP
jgi:hypothetical protein